MGRDSNSDLRISPMLETKPPLFICGHTQENNDVISPF